MATIQSSISIVTNTTTNQNKTYTISNCNNNATDATLAEFAKKLNGLTTNTFSAVFRTTKKDITTATA